MRMAIDGLVADFVRVVSDEAVGLEGELFTIWFLCFRSDLLDVLCTFLVSPEKARRWWGGALVKRDIVCKNHPVREKKSTHFATVPLANYTEIHPSAVPSPMASCNIRLVLVVTFICRLSSLTFTFKPSSTTRLFSTSPAPGSVSELISTALITNPHLQSSIFPLSPLPPNLTATCVINSQIKIGLLLNFTPPNKFQISIDDILMTIDIQSITTISPSTPISTPISISMPISSPPLQPNLTKKQLVNLYPLETDRQLVTRIQKLLNSRFLSTPPTATATATSPKSSDYKRSSLLVHEGKYLVNGGWEKRPSLAKSISVDATPPNTINFTTEILAAASQLGPSPPPPLTPRRPGPILPRVHFARLAVHGISGRRNFLPPPPHQSWADPTRD